MAFSHTDIVAPTRRLPTGIAGWLLFAMLVLSVLRNPGGDLAMWLSGAVAWLAALLLWPRVTTAQRVQMVIIVSVGVVLASWAMLRGTPISLQQALGQNQLILAMLAAVSFLKLVNRPVVAGEQVPVGRAAFLRTLLGLHLFGATLNITAVVIFADRLAAQAPFTRLQALMISRGFCLSVMYSPFIAGMGMALALAPGSRLEVLALAGIPLSVVGLGLTYLLLARTDKGAIETFRGYPIHLESLWLPLVLAVSVLGLHRLYPSLSVLTLISVSAPVLVALVVCRQRGLRGGARRLADHVHHGLPDMSGELLLFLGAGVLAAGLTSVFASFGNHVPFETFDATAAVTTLALIVVAGGIGIHPIVCVSFLAPMLAPIEPDPNLLALVFVSGWAIGCTVSPFSGTNLTMQGRYGISTWAITRGNIGYSALMVAAASVAFVLMAP